MATPGLRMPSRSTLIFLGLVLVAGIFGGRATLLWFVAVPIFVWPRLRAQVRTLMSADRLSRKATWAVAGTFSIALVPGGHGVAPIAMLLVYGWEHFLVAVLLGCLAILVLASSLLGGRHSSTLAFVGGVLALVSWALFEGASDEPLLGALASLPFLGCLVLHWAHLWQLSAPEAASS